MNFMHDLFTCVGYSLHCNTFNVSCICRLDVLVLSLVLSAEAESQKAFALPELEYNIKMLLDISESDIVQIDRQ